MNFARTRFAVFATAASALLACSTDDTIVALNVEATSDVGVVETLSVSITQSGQTPVVTAFQPPTAGDAGVIDSSFFERIKLPEDWKKARADILVEALNASGTRITSDTTQVTIRPEGAVAAFVELTTIVPEPPPSEGGAGGAPEQPAGGNGGTGGTSGGATSMGGSALGGSGGVEGGAAGEAGAGGAAGAAGDGS